MRVVTKKITPFYAVTGIWLCKKEVKRLLSGEDIGIKMYGELDKQPTPFHQDITVHMNEVGRDTGIEVVGME